ncbi:Pycsar system effector family protein [Tundrisphaera sp. TA3]|uniref:Pycsar system effector family protein n=1 Tax=Tundrisphaera sp. TA3 TaxID=3435775 RepID=UPI003EB95E3D
MAEHPPDHDPTIPTPLPLSGRCAEATEHLWKTLQGINEWIRFADAKAGAVLTANGVLATLAAGVIEKQSDLLSKYQSLKIVTLICGLALLLSSIACVKCLYPRVRVKGEIRSLLFFHHIATVYADPPRYLDKARELSEPDMAFREVGTQVWANSRVAREKHREVAFAIGATGASLFVSLSVWIIAILVR